MEIKGYRIELIVVALLVALGLFFGGHYYYKQYQLGNSLIEDLEGIKGVKRVKIQDLNQGKEVELTLGQVSDLKEVHQQINRILVNTFDDNKYKIKLNNPEDQKLITAYRKIHLSIYESIITGEFTEVANQMNQIKSELDIEEAGISVDQDYVYLHLREGKADFYKVIERNYPPNKIVFQGGGDSG